MPPALLARRELRPEIMDRDDLEAARHDEALAGLARLNRWAGSSRPLWRELRPLLHPGAPLSLLDVACGGGDVPLALARRARRAGLRLRVTGLDRSPVAIARAALGAARSGLEAARFERRDVLDGASLPAADVVICTLFLHHLAADEAAALLARMAQAARRLLLVCDLRRGALGWALAYSASRLLSRSPVVRSDAPDSVRSAFSPAELAALASRAGLEGARLRPVAPLRMLLRWRPPEAAPATAPAAAPAAGPAVGR